MINKDYLNHKDAREFKSFLINLDSNDKEKTIDLSHIKRASLSSIQLLISLQKHKQKKKYELQLSPELEEIMIDLGAKDLLPTKEGK
jgi:ABC-type transporter Mla MlaB component